jgi:hypothetical protein
MDEVTRKRHADNRNSLVQAIVALKDRWLHEDEGLDATRKVEMERHEEGLRAHDAMVSGDGGPVMDVAACEAEVAAAQARLDDAKRMAAEREKPVDGEYETKNYSDGSSASGPGPLPNMSPEQQAAMRAASERASMGSADPDAGQKKRDEDAAWAARGDQRMNPPAPGLLQMNQQGEQQVREDEDKRIAAERAVPVPPVPPVA